MTKYKTFSKNLGAHPSAYAPADRSPAMVEDDLQDAGQRRRFPDRLDCRGETGTAPRVWQQQHF